MFAWSLALLTCQPDERPDEVTTRVAVQIHHLSLGGLLEAVCHECRLHCTIIMYAAITLPCRHMQRDNCNDIKQAGPSGPDHSPPCLFTGCHHTGAAGMQTVPGYIVLSHLTASPNIQPSATAFRDATNQRSHLADAAARYTTKQTTTTDVVSKSHGRTRRNPQQMDYFTQPAWHAAATSFTGTSTTYYKAKCLRCITLVNCTTASGTMCQPA